MPKRRRRRHVKDKVTDWKEILRKTYYTLGQPAAFSSPQKLLQVLHKEYNLTGVTLKQIRDWLLEQYTYTIHRPRRVTFKRNPIISRHIDYTWQADVGFLPTYANKNNRMTSFLLVIDVVSRFIWGEPLKTKSGPEITKAFETVLAKSDPRKPTKLQTDRGKEFYNKPFKDLLAEHDIKLYSTHSDVKAAVAERAIRTIKELIKRYMDANDTERWVDKFEDVISTYNNTVHKTIGFKPKEVTKKNEGTVLNRLYGHLWPDKDATYSTRRKAKFFINDSVRISNLKQPFKKGYEGYWSKEIFKISKILGSSPHFTYLLRDEYDEPVEGAFYEYELGPVNVDLKQTYWRVDKILKQKYVGKRLMYYVRFKNYPKPQWLPAKNFTDVKNVRAF